MDNTTSTRNTRNLLISIPESVIEKAHKLYKEQGGEYGRDGGFTNKGPSKVVDNRLWETILIEIYPKAFH